MHKTLTHIIKRIKEGMLTDIWKETLWLYQYTRKYWIATIFYTLLGLSGVAISLISSLVSRNLVDVITGRNTSLLTQTFIIYLSLSIGNLFISQVSNYASNWISLKVNNDIRANVFEKILLTDWESLSQYHSGDLLTRWGNDSSNIANGVLSWIPNLFIYTFRFFSSLFVVWYHDPTFALLAMLGIPVSVLMSRTVLSRMRRNNEKSAQMNAKMNGFNQETFANIQTIKAFSLIHFYQGRLLKLQKEYMNMKMEFQRMSMVTSFIMSIVGILVSNLCYGWGIYRVFTGSISYGTMTMFLSLSGSLSSTLTSLISLVPNAISITTSAGRLMEILEMPKEDYQGSDKVTVMEKTSNLSGIHIYLDNIAYAYQNGNQVFQKVSLEAHPHEIVALVGPSGEGKTTLLRLLLALLYPQSGKAYISTENQEDNGIELCPAARRLFSYVPQGNTMFSGTIAENMRCVKPDATDEEIIRTLQAACAWGFVEQLPDGIHSVIKERGGGFSEGQAQRFSIARALLRQAPILLLDEATSALDAVTEHQVLRNIMKDSYPRTCIVTTHRPSVLHACSKVYEIKSGTCTLLNASEVEAIIHLEQE